MSRMPIRICIVDDSAEVRESVAECMAGAPEIECVGAFESAEEALKCIPSLQPAVVLMDINLPSMSGIQCVRQLKEKMPKLQAMMLTVYENSERIFEALSAGASGYMLKSTSPEQLVEAIKDMHNGGSPMSSHIARKVVQAFHPAARMAPLITDLSPVKSKFCNCSRKVFPTNRSQRNWT